MGTIVTPAFLRRIPVPGRAGERWLNGESGALSLCAVYFATGSTELDEEDAAITARASRPRTRRIATTRIAPSSRRLSLLMGGLNWAADDLGRIVQASQLPHQPILKQPL